MHPRLLLILLAVVSLVGAFALIIGRPRAVDEGQTAQRRAATPMTENGGAPVARPDSVSQDRRATEAQSTPSSVGVTDPAPSAEPMPALTGLVLTGVVRWIDDGTPVAELGLIVDHGGGHVRILTDGFGRYRTEAVVEAGALELRHRPSRPDGPFPSRLRLARSMFTHDGEPGDVHSIDLELVRPDATVLVDVVHIDGSPARDAVVEFEQSLTPRDGDAERHLDRSWTDTNGRAIFALYEPELIQHAGVIARREGGEDSALCSAFLQLETPLHSASLELPVRLVLDAPATIAIRVRAEDGTPAPGRFASVDDDVPELRWWTGPRPITDEDGEVAVGELPAGTYRVSLADEPEVPSVDVVVAPGERAVVEFTTERESQRIAASGRLVDESGAPLADRSVSAGLRTAEGVSLPGRSATTDADGRFEVLAPPADVVVVTADAGVFSDEYDPPSYEVSFGTTELEFRRVRDVQLAEVAFEIFDAVTGELVEDVLVMTYRAPNLRDYSFHRARSGRAAPRCPIHESTHLVLESPGYRRRSLLLETLLASEPENGLRRVELDRGLLRTLRVVATDDDGRSVPVGGARIMDAGVAIGTTDGNGEFEVDLDISPRSGLTIVAEGHEAVTWTPRDGFADLVPAIVEL